jgi:hypothetical protein
MVRFCTLMVSRMIGDLNGAVVAMKVVALAVAVLASNVVANWAVVATKVVLLVVATYAMLETVVAKYAMLETVLEAVLEAVDETAAVLLETAVLVVGAANTALPSHPMTTSLAASQAHLPSTLL